jgi:hypothetical protein
VAPGNRAIEMSLDAYMGQELGECWDETTDRRDGLLLFESRFGRLPTESEIRASEKHDRFIEDAVTDLRALVYWRTWHKDEYVGSRAGYRDDARGIVRRRPIPPPDATTGRPGAARRLLNAIFDVLAPRSRTK